MENDYLLAETEEAQEQREKLKTMLLSTDTTTQKLALNIIKGGGLHLSFCDYLVALSGIYRHGYHNTTEQDEIVELIEEVLIGNEKDDLWNALTYLDFNDNEEVLDFLDKVTAKDDEFFEKYDYLDRKVIAKMVLLQQRMGLRYCLEKKIMPATEMLNLFIENNNLDLSHQSLYELPKEIGELKSLRTLNISYNFITEIPAELAQLKNLLQIYHYEVPLSPQAFTTLENMFPLIYAEEYSNKAGLSYSRGDYSEASQFIDKALSLNPNDANAWITKAATIANAESKYEEAVNCSMKAVEIAEQNSDYDSLTLAWANASGFCRRMRNHENALEMALKGMAIYEKFPNVTRRWESSLYFRKAQALFYLERLEESLVVYEEGLAKYPKDSTKWYNVACIYARWQDKEQMLFNLQRAIELEAKHRPEARIDEDFKEYWKDEDFLALLDI